MSQEPVHIYTGYQTPAELLRIKLMDGTPSSGQTGLTEIALQREFTTLGVFLKFCGFRRSRMSKHCILSQSDPQRVGFVQDCKSQASLRLFVRAQCQNCWMIRRIFLNSEHPARPTHAKIHDHFTGFARLITSSGMPRPNLLPRAAKLTKSTLIKSRPYDVDAFNPPSKAPSEPLTCSKILSFSPYIEVARNYRSSAASIAVVS